MYLLSRCIDTLRADLADFRPLASWCYTRSWHPTRKLLPRSPVEIPSAPCIPSSTIKNGQIDYHRSWVMATNDGNTNNWSKYLVFHDDDYTISWDTAWHDNLQYNVL